jgi:hypothetical protein
VFKNENMENFFFAREGGVPLFDPTSGTIPIIKDLHATSRNIMGTLHAQCLHFNFLRMLNPATPVPTGLHYLRGNIANRKVGTFVLPPSRNKAFVVFLERWYFVVS